MVRRFVKPRRCKPGRRDEFVARSLPASITACGLVTGLDRMIRC